MERNFGRRRRKGKGKREWKVGRDGRKGRWEEKVARKEKRKLCVFAECGE